MGCAFSISSREELPPRVVIDNENCCTATLIRVERRRKHALLLDAVQIFGDLNLSINKAYISSDNGLFMDVFHVTNKDGNKLNDKIINYIQQSLGTRSLQKFKGKGLMELELTGTDQPGLLSEVFTAIADLHGNVVDAKVWTHNGRYALLILYRDDDSGSQDSHKGCQIEAQLRKVLKGDNNIRAAKASLSLSATNTERRLHHLMFTGRDYERSLSSGSGGSPIVSVVDWWVRGYSVVNVACKDRQKLLFGILCTLADMEYVIFHALMESDRCSQASVELSIRHEDGTPIISEAEIHQLSKCLQAAIQRRAFEGVMFELKAPDRRGLLADVTRTLNDEGLNITGAEVSSVNQKAANVFYVTPHVAGHPVEATAIEQALRRKIGPATLKLKEPSHGRLPRALSRWGIS